MIAIGINPTQVRTAAQGPEFFLGTQGETSDSTFGNRKFLYVKAAEAITAAGYLCSVKTGFEVEMTDLTNGTPGDIGHGSRVGAAQAAIASGGFGWIQVYGKGSLRTLASAAKGTRLNVTATSGALDDDGTAGAEAIDGIVLGTATGAAEATNADAHFNFPSVGATL